MKVCKEQKSFGLLWKSYITKEKNQFKEKWIGLGLPEDAFD